MNAQLMRIKATSYDLVVVGATPSGISCAVRAAREGLNVLLVERTQHVGGFMSSGAGGWEAPYDGLRSPLYAEIRMQATEYYRNKYGEGSQQHLASIPTPTSNRHIDRAKIEPKVAEMLFNQMIKRETRLSLLHGFYPVGVERQGVLLRTLKLGEYQGKRTLHVAAKVFVDGTKEGDLAKLANVRYRIGREARSEFNEPHAGVVFTQRCVEQGSERRFSSAAAEGLMKLRTFPGRMCKEHVLPESTGEGDHAVMVYNYRLILTTDPKNKVSIIKPEGYDPTQFEGFDSRNWIPLPNQKIAWNGGALIGPQVDYPEGDWEKRDHISAKLLNYILQQIWFLQNDAPEDVRIAWRSFGLAKDEFVDNNHLPYEVYVREARRIVGRYIFTEHDNVLSANIERTPIHHDSIAITDWPVDLVVCTSRRGPGGSLDGAVFLAESSRPAQVPYRCLLPEGIDNLLVPVCLSATHVGWGAIRLEPVWMQTGEAAGFAAALSIQSNVTPADLDTETLLRVLTSRHFEVTMFNDIDVTSDEPWVPAVQYLGTKGFFRSYDARPRDELTPRTAQIWAELFGRLFARQAYDATAQAARLPKTELPASTQKLTASEFIVRLQIASNLTEKPFDTIVNCLSATQLPDAVILRGSACFLMYQLLKLRNAE